MQQVYSHPSAAKIPPAPGGEPGLGATTNPPVGDDPLDPVGSQMVSTAHDLSNLLSIALGNAGFTRRELGSETRAATYLNSLEAALRQAGELAKAMRRLAEREHFTRTKINLNQVARDMVEVMQASVLARHSVRLDLPATVPPIVGIEVQLRQVALNLLLNAAEACGPEAGRIRVSTMLLKLTERQVAGLQPVQRREPGDYLRLRVVDNGCGMDESIMPRLFHVPATTKGAGRGTGLISVAQIVRDHCGGIRLLTEPGRGTVFDVFLPIDSTGRVRRRNWADQSPHRAGDPKSEAPGTILVADDTEEIRAALSEFLALVGYRVTRAANGQEVLSRLADQPEIDLVLLDVNMPGMDGYDTLEAIRARRGDLPVVLMSGELDAEIRDRFEPLAPAALLPKPFALTRLKEVIGHILSTPAAPPG